MHVLILVEDSQDLEVYGHPEQIRPLDDASPRRDLALLMPEIDPARVQLKIYSVQKDLNAGRRIDTKALRTLVRLLRDEDIELVHAMGGRPAFYAALAGRLAGIPTLASLYGVPFPTKSSRVEQIWQRLVQFVLRRGIDRVVVPSDLIRQNLWRLRYPLNRVEVVYPGVVLNDQEVPLRADLGLPTGPLATMIAPLNPDQGLDTMLEMVPRLLGRVPEAVIAVAGGGPMAQALRGRSRSLPIRWLGERSDIRDIIAASDAAFVHPLKEGLPRAVFEAGAASRPLVASRVAGITEVIEHGINGLLVTPGDSRDLAVQISRLLLQPVFVQNIGATARRRVNERYSLNKQREVMTTIYESTIYASR